MKLATLPFSLLTLVLTASAFGQAPPSPPVPLSAQEQSRYEALSSRRIFKPRHVDLAEYIDLHTICPCTDAYLPVLHECCGGSDCSESQICDSTGPATPHVCGINWHCECLPEGWCSCESIPFNCDIPDDCVCKTQV